MFSIQLRREKKKKRKEEIRNNVLSSIPDHILYSIVNRVSRLGFENLGPLLATGVLGRDLVYKEEVLREACLQTFHNEADLVNTGSIYRPFFIRCVKAGNVVACYLESLRLALREGEIEEAIELLLKTSPLTEEMEFALGIFNISRGHYHNGIQWLESFKQRVGSHERAESVSQLVFAHMREIWAVRCNAKPLYSSTWRFDDVPKCVGTGTACTQDNRCKDCFNYWRSIQFIRMF